MNSSKCTLSTFCSVGMRVIYHSQEWSLLAFVLFNVYYIHICQIGYNIIYIFQITLEPVQPCVRVGRMPTPFNVCTVYARLCRARVCEMARMLLKDAWVRACVVACARCIRRAIKSKKIYEARVNVHTSSSTLRCGSMVAHTHNIIQTVHCNIQPRVTCASLLLRLLALLVRWLAITPEHRSVRAQLTLLNERN